MLQLLAIRDVTMQSDLLNTPRTKSRKVMCSSLLLVALSFMDESVKHAVEYLAAVFAGKEGKIQSSAHLA